jgi:hypothetical protein
MPMEPRQILSRKAGQQPIGCGAFKQPRRSRSKCSLSPPDTSDWPRKPSTINMAAVSRIRTLPGGRPGAFALKLWYAGPMVTKLAWYVAHGPLFEGETIQSFSNEDDAKSAACGYLALGEFVRELGSRVTEKMFRKMDANEIKRFCATRR